MSACRIALPQLRTPHLSRRPLWDCCSLRRISGNAKRPARCGPFVRIVEITGHLVPAARLRQRQDLCSLIFERRLVSAQAFGAAPVDIHVLVHYWNVSHRGSTDAATDVAAVTGGHVPISLRDCSRAFVLLVSHVSALRLYFILGLRFCTGTPVLMCRLLMMSVPDPETCILAALSSPRDPRATPTGSAV